nr:glucodextranase DOMON-like domain-containing protein [Acetohalobium arabaticum]
MERKVKLLIGLMLILLISASAVTAQEALFDMEDPEGDDYGPGTYVYPTSEQFAPFEGLFDLRRVRVEERESDYSFRFKFGTVTNPWHAPYGFSHQLIQVYIDNQDSGATTVFKKGANVKFSKESSWNKLIKITGWNIKVFDYQDDLSQETEPVVDAEAKVLEDKQTIQARIPKELIGSLDSARYYVLIGSLDGFSYDNYRPVIEEVDDWKFGGGTDTQYNPNVLDILVPEDKSQKEILSGYDVEEEELATLYPVGNESIMSSKFLLTVIMLVVIIVAVIIVRYRKRIFNK